VIKHFWRRLAVVLAVMALPLSLVVGSASAAPASTTYYTWENGAGFGFMHNEAANGNVFDSSTANPTSLSAAYDCDSAGYCLRHTTGGKCIEWDQATGNILAASTCDSSNAEEMWSVTLYGLPDQGPPPADVYTWQNLQSDEISNCPSGNDRLLQAVGDTELLSLVCYYTVGENFLWSEGTPAS
jgi:hypothetical protein